MDKSIQIDTFCRFTQVSRETITSLKKYENALIKSNKSLNLIGNSTLKEIWIRHFLDSAQVIDFIDKNDNLFVNEVAPRVHNSGHLTINSYNISQFENHIRAVFQLEQIKLKKISNAEMINLLGDQISIYKNKQLQPNEFFFDI